MKNHADLWLAYKEIKNFGDSSFLKKFYISGASASDRTVANAITELKTGLKSMLGIEPEVVFEAYSDPIKENCGKDILDNEEYTVSLREDGISLSSKSGAGILYAAFDVLRNVSCERDIKTTYAGGRTVRPSNPLRMLNHWDNMDGSIERGYSGIVLLCKR